MTHDQKIELIDCMEIMIEEAEELAETYDSTWAPYREDARAKRRAQIARAQIARARKILKEVS